MQLRFATRISERLVGLIRNDICTAGEVLVLSPCSSIHTYGMKSSIDVAFIDCSGRVMKAVRSLPPGHLCCCRAAKLVLERRCQIEAPWFEVGEVIRLSKFSPIDSSTIDTVARTKESENA